MTDVKVDVLRVFCGPDGNGGNELGVVLDGRAVVEDDRQPIARMLGYSETVFVDDPRAGRVRIYTPAVELPFAGHPCVGTGWLLRERGYPAEALLTPAGRVALAHDPSDRRLCVATARACWSPPFELDQLDSAAEVETSEPAGEEWRYLWAWLDEAAGLVRARCFVSGAGIAEDEATGSAAVALCAALGRPIEVRQGRASVIYARPVEPTPGEPDDLVEFGGRVAVV